VATRWGGDSADPQYAEQLLALLLSLRGSVCLYQGEELGLPQADVPFERLVDPEALANWPLTLGRDGARTPFPWTSDPSGGGFGSPDPWLPMDVRHRDLSVARQELDSSSMLMAARRLLTVRRGCEALIRGEQRLEEPVPGVVAMARGRGKATVWCLYALQGAVTIPAPEGATRVLAGRGALHDGQVQLPAHGYLWLGHPT
jgi:alpha-glucosidase